MPVSDVIKNFSFNVSPLAPFGDKVYGLCLEKDPDLTLEENLNRFLTLRDGTYILRVDDWWDVRVKMNTNRPPDDLYWRTEAHSGTNYCIGGSEAHYLTYLTGARKVPPESPYSTDPNDYYWGSSFTFGGQFYTFGFTYDGSKYKYREYIPRMTYNQRPNDYVSSSTIAPVVFLALYTDNGDNTVTWNNFALAYKNFFNDIENGEWNYYTFGLEDFSVSEINYDDDPEPPEPPTPPTPGRDDDMDYPNSKLGACFTTMYAMSPAQVNALGNYIGNRAGQTQKKSFMNDLLEDMGFINGIVTDAIIDVCAYPCNIPTITDCVQTNYVKLGFGPDHYVDDLGVSHSNLGLLNISPAVWKISAKNNNNPYFADINFDSLITKFNDFRDYPPFRTFELYLPYVGIVPIDARKFYGKYLSVEYLVDIFTGMATVLLKVKNSVGENGRVVDTFDAQLGVHQAVSSTSWAEYASRYGSARSSVAQTGLQLGLTKGSKGADSIYDSTRELFMAQGNYTGNTSGTFSSCNGFFMPQHIYLIEYTQETSVTGNLSSLAGRKSNTSAAISSFSGFLRVSDVDLVCPRATESEKAEIISLLTSGIRI